MRQLPKRLPLEGGQRNDDVPLHINIVRVMDLSYLSSDNLCSS
jgi:hypothetical protein